MNSPIGQVGAILAHFSGLSYRDVMHRIPWALLARMMADQPNYEPEKDGATKDAEIRDRINQIKR